MTDRNGNAKRTGLAVGTVLGLLGAGAGYYLASGLGEAWLPTPARMYDYIGITLTCFAIPAILGFVLGTSIQRLLNRRNGS